MDATSHLFHPPPIFPPVRMLLGSSSATLALVQPRRASARPKPMRLPLGPVASVANVVTAPAISADGRYGTFVLGDSSSPRISQWILPRPICACRCGCTCLHSCQPCADRSLCCSRRWLRTGRQSVQRLPSAPTGALWPSRGRRRAAPRRSFCVTTAWALPRLPCASLTHLCSRKMPQPRPSVPPAAT